MPTAPTQDQQQVSTRLNEALAAIWDRITSLDAEAQGEILVEFEAAATEIVKGLRAAADAEGIVPVAQTQAVIGRVNLALEGLRAAQEALAVNKIGEAAVIGTSAITELQAAVKGGHVPAELVSRLPNAKSKAHEVAQQVAHAVGEDGLTLSDRVWRINKGLREQLLPQIQRAIVQGEEARTTVRRLLIEGGKATTEQINQIEMARAGALADQVTRIFTGDQATAYANTLRVVRTEVDKANILSTRAAIFSTQGVVATRFLLSPNHPRFDICDVHASVNLHGLGPGVYPPGTSPLPAHPNTLSYEEAVFDWEVDPAHRDTRDDLIGWLQARTPAEQAAVLQSTEKVAALKAGLLQPDEITKPWRELKSKYGPQIGAA